ncbi:hypothetical protein [Methanopyrus sp. KOL6]|uniref:hypothetical protein n=1 Tax=Methanopyrus sp. KOL6 TaxID=1937004 RepID=UPI000B4AFA49|nr:hypothetical protein [Methanopyrus sp. KOL6]
MFLIRSVPEEGFVSCTYGVVPSDAMYLADLVLQSLEDRVDELLGVEFSSSSVVLESITGDVGVVLLTETDPESVIESVSRVLGSDRVEGVRGEDTGDVVDYLETVVPDGAVVSRSLDVLGDMWCVVGAGTALLSGYVIPDMWNIKPGETLSWDSFHTSWHRL